MSLDKILSISGKPGLYKIVTQTRTGFVAESLLDKKRITVNINSNVSVLSEIAVYTLKEELPLKEVLKKIKDKEAGKQPLSVIKTAKNSWKTTFLVCCQIMMKIKYMRVISKKSFSGTTFYSKMTC